MKLYIKNMVSDRCKMAVKSELEKVGLHFTLAEYCEFQIKEEITAEQLNHLRKVFQKMGFDLLEDKKSILVEKIKMIIIELVHYSDEQIRVNLSDYLSEHLNHNYTYVARLFTEQQGNNIEQFYINHKIERIKELLIYNELTITEIADKLHYSSVAHLSNQFKKMTGLTPSEYKHLKYKRRELLEYL